MSPYPHSSRAFATGRGGLVKERQRATIADVSQPVLDYSVIGPSASRYSRLALASIVWALISVPTAAFLPSILDVIILPFTFGSATSWIIHRLPLYAGSGVSVIMGALALNRIRQSQQKLKGKICAIFAVASGVLWIIIQFYSDLDM